MTRKLFGTDGIRGLANKFPMTPEIALKVGMAAGRIFTRGDHRHRVVIGKDTRLSGYMIESALVSGFTSVGMDVSSSSAAADAGGCDADALAARRFGRDDFGLAQRLPRQRHQAVRPRRPEALRRAREGNRSR
jgi:phosphomannomutase